MTELQARITTQSKQPPTQPLQTQLHQTNPVLYAFKYLNSPETQRQYPQRLKHFFDHAELPGRNIEEQGQAFLDKASGSSAAANTLARYKRIDKRSCKDGQKK